MTTYDIHIYVSDGLHQWTLDQGYSDGFRCGWLAKTFMDGAFNHSSSHDVNCNVRTDNRIVAPIEQTHTSFDARYPCTNYVVTFNHLFDWWGSYIDASCTSIDDTVDCNLLIVIGNDDGAGAGGNASGNTAVAGSGRDMITVTNSYYEFGYDDHEDDAIDTIQEEIGHTLIGNAVNYDGDGAGAHDYGRVEYDSGNGKYAITPLGMIGDENNCVTNNYSKSLTDTDSDDAPDGWAHYYSQCAFDHFK